MENEVKHPKHYGLRGGVECIVISQTFNFNLGNVIKYVWRAGWKDHKTHIIDLEKAKQYLEFEIERLKNENDNRST